MLSTYGGKPFQKIPEACKTTGMSQFWLRKGCKDGTIPHVKSGQTYYINIPALLEQLGVLSQAQADATGTPPGR